MEDKHKDNWVEIVPGAWSIRLNEWGFPVAIVNGETDIVHVNPTARTGYYIQTVIDKLNS